MAYSLIPTIKLKALFRAHSRSQVWTSTSFARTGRWTQACRFGPVQRVTHRRSRVRADTAALPPRQVEAPDKLQVEGMTVVQHGEAQNVGLIVHHVVQPKQREVLRRERERDVTTCVCAL